MSYKHFGRLAGSTHTAIKSLTEMAPPNTLTPFNAQSPATKFLAYGEDATSLAFNRALSALSANTDYLASILHGPSLREEILSPFRITIPNTDAALSDGTETAWRSGVEGLEPSNITTGQTSLHLGTVGSFATPVYWVHVGLHKHQLGEKVTFFQSQNQDFLGAGNNATGYSSFLAGGEYVGPQSPKIRGETTPSTVHVAEPTDAYLNQVNQAAAVSYFEPRYKAMGGQEYVGSASHGIAIHVPPVERIKTQLTPYGGDWRATDIYKWDTDGVYLKEHTFAELLLRPGCFVEIAGDGEEHVNQKNNGLFQIAAIVNSDHKPGIGGPGDKAILTRGGLYRVTVRDWRVFGRGELVSWASAPNHKDEIEDTAQKPGLRRNYAHVSYIIPRPDLPADPNDMRGDLYLALHSAEDDFPQPIPGAVPATSSGGKVGSPQVATNSRYLGRYRNSNIGSPDQETPVHDFNNVEVMNALQNHSLLPGTRLYHGHAHFYPGDSPWTLDASFAMPYAEILGGPSAPHSIVGPGEPVAFDTGTVPGKVWPCSPPGFILNPSFSFATGNTLYAGEYVGKAKTLTTVRESLLVDSAIAGSGWRGGGEVDPESILLDSWLRFIRYGHLSPTNAKYLGTGLGVAGITSQKLDDLNSFTAPTKQILGSDLWEVEFEHRSGAVHATIEAAYTDYLGLALSPFVGDLAEGTGVDAGAPFFVNFTHPLTTVPIPGKARIISLSGNIAVLGQVHWTSYDVVLYPNQHDFDGWSTGRDSWPVTDDGAGSFISFTTSAGATHWQVKAINKAPWVDDQWGRGEIPGQGLSAAYNNDYSSNPRLRGDVDDTIGQNSGSGNVIWVNPGRPFTTVLPGGETLSEGSYHRGGTTHGQGEIAHHTETNHEIYNVLHRVTYRHDDGAGALWARTELSSRLGHSHAHTVKLYEQSNQFSTFLGQWYENLSAAGEGNFRAVDHKYTYSETMVGGSETSQRLLLVDETTASHGVSPEIGDWGDHEVRQDGLGVSTPDGFDINKDHMHATVGKDGLPQHGVFLSNNLSKVTQSPQSTEYYDQPAFDSRSTPQEVQDRSILGAIEGTLLGNYTQGSGRDGEVNDIAGSGTNDIDSFGALSNGVLKGAKTWIAQLDSLAEYPQAAVKRVNGSMFGDLNDEDVFIGEAYFLAGGAKWYQPETILNFASSGNNRHLICWSLDYRKYVVHQLDGEGRITHQWVGQGTSVGGDMVGEYPSWDAAHEIPIAIVDVVGTAQSVTDVRRRVQRQDQKTSIYVGDTSSTDVTGANHGYIDDSLNFKTLGAAFAALEAWSRGLTNRSWTIEVVGPVQEMGSTAGGLVESNGRGVTYPIRMPCDGITVRGLHGRDDTGGEGLDAGWNIRNSSKLMDTPVITWGNEIAPIDALFDLNGRYGITFENLSFRFAGKLDNQIPGSSLVAPHQGITPTDCLFMAGNEAYGDGSIVHTDIENDKRRDRESFDALYGHPLVSPNSAYSGKWVFRNIDCQGGGGFLTTIRAWYSIDNVVVEHCSARGVLSFVTIGLDSGTPWATNAMNGGLWAQANGKFHSRFRIENNYATFPPVKHYRNGDGWLVDVDMEKWVPGPGRNLLGALGGSSADFQTWDGEDGEVSPVHAMYKCGVFAERTKEIYVSKNTFAGFYTGVTFSKPLNMIPAASAAAGYKQEHFCEGFIDQNIIHNTQSHGIYTISGSPRSNISITNNQVKDPGAPCGASGSTNGMANIFDYEAWCIKICASQVTCTGNQLVNAFRSSPNQTASIGSPEGYENVDASGLNFGTVTGDMRGYPRAGGILVANPLALQQLGDDDQLSGNETVDASTDRTILSGNRISLSGRALFGFLLTDWCSNTTISGNIVSYDKRAISSGVAPSQRPIYSGSNFVQNPEQYPWGAYIGQGAKTLKLVNNTFDANVFVGEKANQAIIADNTIRTPWGHDASALLRISGRGVSVTNNKICLGHVVVGQTGDSCHAAKITNNDLSPFGDSSIVSTDINTMLQVTGAGSHIVCSGNTTHGGPISFSGPGNWHGSKISNNSTGCAWPGYGHGYQGLDAGMSIPGGDIVVISGDGISITNNTTVGGDIIVSSKSDDWAHGSWHTLIDGNQTFGGVIRAWGRNLKVVNNDCTIRDYNASSGSSSYNANSSEACIEVKDAHDSQIVNNTVIGFIDVRESNSVLIAQNRGWHGIKIASSPRPVITDNTFRPPKHFEGAWNTLARFEITDCYGAIVSGNALTEVNNGLYFGKAVGTGLTHIPKIWPDGGGASHGMKPGSWGYANVTGDPYAWTEMIETSVVAMKGYLDIKDCSYVQVTNNMVTQVRVAESQEALISGNTCVWGGANPGVSGNVGIWIKRGNSNDRARVTNNRVWGSILLERRAESNHFKASHCYQVSQNLVGSPMRGDFHGEFNQANFLHTMDDPENPGTAIPDPYYHTESGQGRAWAGGGGHIIIDERGGLNLFGNQTVVDQWGCIKDEGVENFFDLREFGGIHLNRFGEGILEQAEGVSPMTIHAAHQNGSWAVDGVNFTGYYKDTTSRWEMTAGQPSISSTIDGWDSRPGWLLMGTGHIIGDALFAMSEPWSTYWNKMYKDTTGGH